MMLVSFANGEHLAADPGTQAGATGSVLEWKPAPDVTAIRVSAGPAYANVEMDRLLVHTADYTLDIVTARATDGKVHRFEMKLTDYTELPRKGNSARFVAVHEPFTMVQLIVKVSEVRPGVIAIQTISALDEIVVEPGKFEYTTSSLR